MSIWVESRRIQKLGAGIEQNPKHVRFEDLDRLLRGYGFAVRQPKRGSSHYVYKRAQWLLTVPYRRLHFRDHYVKEALAYVEEIEALEGEGPVLSPALSKACPEPRRRVEGLSKGQPDKPMRGQADIETRRKENLAQSRILW